jgi:hypothetical protein
VQRAAVAKASEDFSRLDIGSLEADRVARVREEDWRRRERPVAMTLRQSRFKGICVFCGSSQGKKRSYHDAAIELGNELVITKSFLGND